ncbi:Leucyl aminopeptidase yscIV [Saxophila tyrrhenica]|uniref:Leucyl aminopeptidase yscIV n=1 Tax=Saxophila tyrrhenica TaxID=1690608 RepID=A0AAV9P778_9PEZI|nr:Leucyl aminopeptidase yscIV [Saxophila tyrrhenica]
MAIRPISDAAAEKAAASIHQPRDPNTLSNYNAWRTKRTTADFNIDFDAKKVVGHVTLSLARLAKEPKIVLDTSYLDITSVEVAGSKADYELAPSRMEPYGSPLTIQVDDKHANEDELDVRIGMQTTKDCTGLQWFDPAQTSNKKHPYMFSQCQAIHGRSLFPCQDTPDVKSQYTFNIRSPLPVLASGLSTGARDFQPGKDGKSGPRSTVWTGPEELQECQWEFEHDTEPYIQAAEKIVYPYAWTTYNVLVLPPSFPYGGMENPMYTFATPTLISGDRQNVDVIAHELAHSWSGNLVSNASWEHFWLNEGWTVYLERRLQAAVHGGDQYRDFSAIIGWTALREGIERFGEEHEFTKLIVDLKGKDPDDAFSTIPYEKGSTFLYYLEKLVGKQKWDKFIPHYFTTYKERSVDSYEFKATLLDFFASDADASKKLNDLDWDTWFYKPGYPPKPDFDTTLADQCYALAEKWKSLNSSSSSDFTPSPSDISNFTANQIVVFLEALLAPSPPLTPSLVEKMGSVYGLAASKNVELVSRYYLVGLQAKTESLYEPAAELVGKVGRMKYVRWLFRELMKVDLALARRTFEGKREFYHPICRGMVEKMFREFEGGGEVK